MVIIYINKNSVQVTGAGLVPIGAYATNWVVLLCNQDTFPSTWSKWGYTIETLVLHATFSCIQGQES